MKNKRLQLTIITTFCVLMTIMLGLQALTICGSVAITEDNVINFILEEEATRYIESRSIDENAPRPQLSRLQTFVGTADMPDEFISTIIGKSDGLYETEGPGKIPGPDGYNILIKTIPDSKDKLYLFYKIAEPLRETNVAFHTVDIYLMLFGATTLLGIVLSWIVGFIVFKPLRNLAEKIDKVTPEDTERIANEATRRDEIGLLAGNIQQSYKRINKLVERERRFTRDVSHELRTPLSIIKGATDLIPIALPEPTPKVDRLLARIHRATDHMQETITTFLWLARADNLGNTNDFCDVNAAVHTTVQDLKPSLKKDDVKLTLQQDEHILIPVPEGFFRIVFSNLLTNALTHTQSGSIDIRIEGSRVTVSDTGTGIPDDISQSILEPYVQGKRSTGFGLGLSIAKNICDRFDWQLSIKKRPPAGTLATISFPDYSLHPGMPAESEDME